MATESPASPRLSWGSVVAAILAVALVVLAAGIAVSTLGPRATGRAITMSSGEGSTNPAPATVPPALPMPDADLISTVLDEALVAPAPAVSADQAIALGRANPSGLVGASPRVQLVSTTTTRPESPLDGFTGWVILSTDVQGHLYGPITALSVTEYATYSWVFVTVDGDVIVATQNTYLTPESVPSLPPE